MSELKIDKIKEAIKNLLKKNGYSYQDLADQLECSLPTVKRILGPEEITLSRLYEICDFLNVELSDLEILYNSMPKEKNEFTTTQQKFLVKNRGHFMYLMNLYGGMTPKDIQKKYKLTKLSVDKYLVALEKHELIKVTNKGRVKTSCKTHPEWGNGLLAKMHYENFIDKGAQFYKKRVGHLLNRKKDGKDLEEGMSIQVFRVTEETYKKCMKDLRKSYEDFFRLASIEEKTKDKKDLKTTVIQTAFSLVDSDYKDLNIFENTFGDIINL